MDLEFVSIILGDIIAIFGSLDILSNNGVKENKFGTIMNYKFTLIKAESIQWNKLIYQIF